MIVILAFKYYSRTWNYNFGYIVFISQHFCVYSNVLTPKQKYSYLNSGLKNSPNCYILLLWSPFSFSPHLLPSFFLPSPPCVLSPSLILSSGLSFPFPSPRWQMSLLFSFSASLSVLVAFWSLDEVTWLGCHL